MRISDWSSDVCSSDLAALLAIVFGIGAGMYGARRSDKPHSVRAGHLSGAPVANDIQAIVGGNDRGVRRSYGLRPNEILIDPRSEEHTSELQSLMRISYAVFCLKKKNITNKIHIYHIHTYC